MPISVSMDSIRLLAPDAKALATARSIAKPTHWTSLGYDDKDWIWGRCEGSSTYIVAVSPNLRSYDCDCPSRKRPCKHALGLLILAAGGHPIPSAPLPAGHLDSAREWRYRSSYE